MAWIEILIVVGTILYILYKYGTSTYDYWEKKGVNHIKARIPFLGSNADTFLKKDSIIGVICKMYNAFPDQR